VQDLTPVLAEALRRRREAVEEVLAIGAVMEEVAGVASVRARW
jgi:hypothetical protein